jgi:peptide chain release factor 1
VTGEGARTLFEGERGGHRWQRIPPTEKRGRVHSSTITVVVLDEDAATDIELREEDLEWTTCRASGNGGQHVQKTDSAVRVTHVPTGTSARSQDGRSQYRNKETARARLRGLLAEIDQSQRRTERADARRTQAGSGMRGDKRRTIRVQDDSVVDHETGRTWRYRDYLRGNW